MRWCVSAAAGVEGWGGLHPVESGVSAPACNPICGSANPLLGIPCRQPHTQVEKEEIDSISVEEEVGSEKLCPFFLLAAIMLTAAAWAAMEGRFGAQSARTTAGNIRLSSCCVCCCWCCCCWLGCCMTTCAMVEGGFQVFRIVNCRQPEIITTTLACH